MDRHAVSILIADLSDATMVAVVDHLRALADDHLVNDLLAVDVASVTEATASASGIGHLDGSEGDLYALLGQRQLDIVRVCAIAHPASTRVTELGIAADAIERQLEVLKPADTMLKSVRIWAAVDSGDGPPSDFLIPSVDANLILIPEDRASATQFGVPLADIADRRFTESVAVELATHLGLWVGISSVPLDQEQAGVIGYGSPKIHLVRSFARVASGPSVPIAPILVEHGRAMFPKGGIETANPQRYIDELIVAADSILEPIASTSPDRPESGQVETSIGGGWRTLGSFLWRFLISLPMRVIDGALENLIEFAGLTTQEVVGRSSIIEIVWRDQVEQTGFGEDSSLADRIARDARDRIDMMGGIPIDPQMWLDLNLLIAGSVDGGEIPDLEMETETGLVPVISDVARVVAAPTSDLLETMSAAMSAALTFEVVEGEAAAEPDADDEEGNEESVTDEEQAAEVEPACPTLVSRVGDVIDRLHERHTDTLNDRIKGMVALLRLIGSGPPAGIGIALGIAAFLLTLLLTEIFVFTGLASSLISDWSTEAKDGAWVIVSLVVFLLFAALGYIGYSSAKRLHHIWQPILAGLVAATLVSFVTQILEFTGVGATTKEKWATAITSALVVGGITVAARLMSLGRENRTAGRLGRVTYGIWLLYFAFILVGIVVRPDSWLDSLTGLSQIYMTLGTLLAMLLAVVFAGYREFLWRHQLRAAVDEVAWFENEIIEAVRRRAIAEEVLQHYRAFAAAWSYLAWNPAGQVGAKTRGMEQLAQSNVLKARFMTFDLTDRGEQQLRNSTRQEISSAGWLTQQYELAVTAFQSDDNVRMGLGEALRPDQDTRPISSLPDSRRFDVSSRWRFAGALVAAELDYALLDRFDDLEPLTLYEDVLRDTRNLALRETGPSTMAEFFLALQQGVDSDVATSHFTMSGRKSVSADQRKFTSQIWWPEVELPGLNPTADGDICKMSSSRESVVVISARSDWAGPFVFDAVSDQGVDQAPARPENGNGDGPSV